MMPEQLRACEPCRQRPGRMGASVIAVDNGDIFGPQEASLWPYVSKDAQYGACIDTHVKGRIGPGEGLFDLNHVLPAQGRDRADGTPRQETKRGRASCQERGCQYVKFRGVDVA